jgi:hypothetical protein
MLSISSFNAEATPTISDKASIRATDDIKNDPLAMKVLQNIEISKQILAKQLQKTLAMQQEQQFISEQRRLANEYLQRDLAALDEANAQQVSIDFASLPSNHHL